MVLRCDMCEFCDGREKRIENGFTYGNAHIVKNNFGYSYSLRYDNSADEYGEGAFEINYCPICGRKLCDETETPIEHFLKSEMERSKLRMNAYAEFFDGVHVDNDTRKKLLESHIRFCKNALKQCMDV